MTLRRVSGFRRDQMYTSVLDNAEPRNGMEVVRVLRTRSEVQAYSSNQEKTADDGPDPCSTSREYRWRKKMWKARSREGGPKYMKVVNNRQYCNG